jgi:hypothetical protein
MFFYRAPTGLYNSAELAGMVLHTSGMCCVAQQIFESSGQNPMILKIWIFG